MILNYIKIAFRSLQKNKGYSFLNIFGLAIGITCASLIFLWVEDEMSFNTSFPNQDQVYYVPTHQNYDGQWRTIYATPGPLAQAMKDEIPGILKATRSSREERLFTVGDNAINRTGRYADADFLEIFSLEFLEGNAKEAFKNPEAIVLTRQTADELFGMGTPALGKVVRVNNQDNYLVSGVVKNLPKNVTFPFDWIAPFERYRDGAEWMEEYGNNFSDTFVLLSPEADFETVNAAVRAMIPEKSEDSDTVAFLHTIKDWHLRSKFEGGKKVGGRIKYVRLFTIIALIILLIACINFMNLSTARSEKRANEVGVRKAMGSGRSRLVVQFISEALIMSFFASLVSILLLYLLLPQFNLVIGKELVVGLNNPFHIVALTVITLFCGLLAGLYPAFYLSSFKPVQVLKGIKVTHGSASLIRKSLVVGQFAASIVFIISTVLVYQQIQHVKNRDLGYEKDQLLVMKAHGDVIEKFSVIEQDLINTGAVKHVGLSNSRILSGGYNGSGFQWPGGTNTEDVLISFRHVSKDFFNTAGMKLAKGRTFGNSIDADSTHIIISESFARLMGDTEPIGSLIHRGGEDYEVIGVMKDYLYGDMYGTSDPVMFFHYHNYSRFLYLKTNAAVATSEMIAQVEKVMNTHNPAFPFEYEFVDESFDAMFKNEQLVGTLSQLFAILAILISCLGLFGLAAYTAEQRSKEIGVRKVLGASVSSIVRLLSKDFLKLVILAIIVAIPIAWLTMSNWLQEYAYRIEINGWIFIIAGVIAMLIALITVSFQAVKAAIANPVDSLKTE